MLVHLLDQRPNPRRSPLLGQKMQRLQSAAYVWMPLSIRWYRLGVGISFAASAGFKA
jgi:hypothetical protein